MKIKAPIVSTAVAMLAGLVVLFLRLFPTGLDALYQEIVRWAAALAATALVVGAISLLNTHVDRVTSGARGAAYSLILIISMAGTFLLALGLGPTGTIGSTRPVDWLFRYIQVPVEGSLVALLAVSLIYAASRLLRRRPNVFSIVFLAAGLITLLGGSLLAGGAFGLFSDALRWAGDWVAAVPAAAGARGLLIGVALGAVAAGLRILIGTDRPYGG